MKIIIDTDSEYSLKEMKNLLDVINLDETFIKSIKFVNTEDVTDADIIERISNIIN